MVQLALAHAARQDADPLGAFWAQAMRLRDLLKFDFYFADSAAYRENVAREMSVHPDWESTIAAGGERISALLRSTQPLTAAATLRPFFEADLIFVDALRGAAAGVDDSVLMKRALGLGRQYVAQNRVRSNESASMLLFATARQVAGDQGLIEPAGDLDSRRSAFRSEVRAILGDIDMLADAAVEQFLGRSA